MTDYQLTIHTPSETAVRRITAEPEHLAQEVHRHARGLLGSQRVTIHLNPDTLTGEITSHAALAGTFTLAPTLDHPPRDTEPMHGYTAADIDHIVWTAISIDRWRSGDVEERADAARFAIVEYLCTTKEQPTRRELVHIATRASDRHVIREMHHHGWDIDNISAGAQAMAGYQRYWQASPTPSPESRIITHQARQQIWPMLTDRQQQALKALGDTGDYQLAATALGVAESTFRVLVSTARRRYLLWWHEGETPSKVWRTDRHLYSRMGTWRGRQLLTVSEVDALRGRYHAGERLAPLAAEAGVTTATLSALISGRATPAPDRPAAA